MTYILKTYAITGKLVPVNAQHIAYRGFSDAVEAASRYAKDNDVQVVVKHFETDEDVAYVS